MFEMKFTFDRTVPGVEQINAALASMRLSALSIKDSDGYLSTQRTFDNNQQLVSTKLNYGYDSIEFECEQDDSEDMYTWQLETEAYPKGEFATSDAYHDFWCSLHPGRVMRVMQMISFDTSDAFVVLHHERRE